MLPVYRRAALMLLLSVVALNARGDGMQLPHRSDGPPAMRPITEAQERALVLQERALALEDLTRRNRAIRELIRKEGERRRAHHRARMERAASLDERMKELKRLSDEMKADNEQFMQMMAELQNNLRRLSPLPRR